MFNCKKRAYSSHEKIVIHALGFNFFINYIFKSITIYLACGMPSVHLICDNCYTSDLKIITLKLIVVLFNITDKGRCFIFYEIPKKLIGICISAVHFQVKMSNFCLFQFEQDVVKL